MKGKKIKVVTKIVADKFSLNDRIALFITEKLGTMAMVYGYGICARC